MAFTLHPKLAEGGFDFGRLCGCRLMLKNNAVFPWFILVPEVEQGIEDLHQLDSAIYAEVMEAVRLVSVFIADEFRPEKLNVACIGNQVRQMHIHLVGRSTGDPAWPGTVWAFDGSKSYQESEVADIRAKVMACLPLT